MREKRGIFYITRILSKLSIIIPIMLAFSLYYDSKILYIEELDYMRRSCEAIAEQQMPDEMWAVVERIYNEAQN